MCLALLGEGEHLLSSVHPELVEGFFLFFGEREGLRQAQPERLGESFSASDLGLSKRNQRAEAFEGLAVDIVILD